MRSDDGNVPQVDAGTAAIAAELGHHTPLLEGMHRALTRGKPERLEDAQTFAFPTGSAGAFVFDPAVPATAEVEIEAWQGPSAGVPLYVLDGDYTEAQAAALASSTDAGYLPILCVIPAAGVARVHRAQFSGRLTVCSMGNPTTATLATVKVKACAS